MFERTALQVIPASKLDPAMPIFNSLRDDYSEFPTWIEAVQLDSANRTVLLSTNTAGDYQGVAILKHTEFGNSYGLEDPTSKLSTFVVREECRGNGLGQQLLEGVIQTAELPFYIEVHPWHEGLIRFLLKRDFLLLPFPSTKGELVFHYAGNLS